MVRRLWAGLALLTVCGPLSCAAVRLLALPEYLRPDPFGGTVAADRVAGAVPENRISVDVPRAGYGSFQLIVGIAATGEYSLETDTGRLAPGVSVETFREWFHFVPSAAAYYPDALIPVTLPYRGSFPDTDNRVAKQAVQAFWVDIWAPAAAAPGNYPLTVRARCGGQSASLTIQVKIRASVIPSEDSIILDHNAYGTSWFASQYPELAGRSGTEFFESSAFFELIHFYHRLFYEHRGTFHQLGYGHAGKVGPEFAPELSGWGKDKRISSWDLYDRHYGPLFDGTAFAKTHRGARPIPFAYLPINPEWPASFEWWGEPGYEREFVTIAAGMEKHFREKGWTHTNLEMFFNHKKRYRGFPWDGDEVRFPKDYAYFREYARLLKQAVPAGSPVKFVFRADVSWTMERQWRELAGVVNFWVCGGGMFSWFPDAPRMLRERGDIVWTYGGTPAVTEPSSAMGLDALRTWIQGAQGFVRWETTAPGPDPWFHFGGGGENLVYPGDRFGVAGPLPSIRLKLERNAVQDIDLLEECARRAGRERVRAGAARSFNGTSPEEWWTPRPALAGTSPEDWSNADIEDASPIAPKFGKLLDSAAGQRVRNYVYGAAQESK